MFEYSRALINVNTAKQSDLVAIPGVGPAIARKIIAARPFSSLDDLEKVGGISSSVLEQIRPYLEEIPAKTKKASPAKKAGGRNPAPAPAETNETYAPEEEENLKEKIQDFISQQPEKLQDFLDDQPENFKKARDFIAAQPEKIQEFIATQPERFEKVKTSTGMSNANLMTLLIACLATMMLTILLTIGLMGAINGGLRFASQADFTALNRQAAADASRLEMLEKDTDSIRGRLDALESMSGRMKLIEEENAAIRKQLDESNRQVNEVRAQMEQTRADIERLQSSSNFFERIISGLRTLLNETIQP